MAEQPPLAGVEAGHEGEDVESAAYPISLVGGCLQPDVAHTLDLFLSNDLCHLGIVRAHMRKRSAQHAHPVTIPHPLARHVEGPVLHTVFG